MNDLQRASLWLLGFALLAAGGWWGFHQLFEKKTRTEYIELSAEAQANDYLAVERFLRAGGLDVESINTTHDALTRPGPEDTLLIFSNRFTLRRGVADQLLGWVSGGGRLVVEAGSRLTEDDADTDRDWLLNRWQVAVDEREYCADEEGKDAGCLDDVIPEYGEYAVELPNGDSVLVDSLDTQYLASAIAPNVSIDSAAGPWVAGFDHDEGQVVVLIELVTWWGNWSIGDYDHASVLWQLVNLDGRPNKVWLLYREDMPPLPQWLWQQAWPVISVLAAILMLLLWRAWPRFGPLLPMLSQPRRSLREHVRAAGRWRWGNGQSGGLLHGLREALAIRINQVHPGWQHLERDEFDRRVGQLSGLSGEEVDLALRGNADGNPSAFTHIVKLLATIKQNV